MCLVLRCQDVFHRIDFNRIVSFWTFNYPITNLRNYPILQEVR